MVAGLGEFLHYDRGLDSLRFGPGEKSWDTDLL
jgi:hypothetical protein